MKKQLTGYLKRLGIYHPLQSFYRGTVLFFLNNYYRLAYLTYKGNGYTCNFCEQRYDRFVPDYPTKTIATAINGHKVVAGYGENVYCPNCMSKNRDRLVLAVVRKYLNFNAKAILHFSPEKNLYNFLKSKTSITAVDLMPGFYKNIDKAIGYADATCLSFSDNSFDLIIANHILEHIPEDLKAMKEIQRVLKKDGVAILQVPYSEKLETTFEEPFINDPKKQELLFGQKDHVRIYALDDYLKRLENAGFAVKVLQPGSLQEFRKFAIQEEECVFLCYKKVAFDIENFPH